MYPIRPIGHDDGIHAVERLDGAHVRRETDDEANERRRRDAREDERRRLDEAAAKGRAVPAVPGQPAITPADAAPDGHPHCDVRA